MSKEIKELYTKKGLITPNGKGMHTKKFHKIATGIMESESKDVLTDKEKSIAYATAMKRLGRDKSVKKSHWRGTSDGKMKI